MSSLRAMAGQYASYRAYRRQFEQVGLGPQAAVAAQAHRAGRSEDVPEVMVRAVCAVGDAARDRVEAFGQAGADLPIVYPVATADAAASIEGTLLGLAPGLKRLTSPPLRDRFVPVEYGLQGRHRGKGEKGKMTYTICEPCIDIKDKGCVDECPVDCIYEGPRMLYIHPDECVDCGACEPVCPVTAIFYEDDVPAEWKQFTPINAEWFNDDVSGVGSPGGAAQVGPSNVDHPVVAAWPTVG